MAAAITDLVTQATNGTRPTPTTLTALKSIGAGSISVGALTGWPTATAVHFIIYTIDASGNKVAGSQTDWKGIASGTTISSLTLKAGTDNGYSVGAIVEAAPTAAWANDVVAAWIVDHTQLGYHADLHAANGKVVLGLTDGASTVNNIRATSANTGLAPVLSAEGTDTNIDFYGRAKGTGVAHMENPDLFAGWIKSGAIVAQTAGLTGSFSDAIYYIANRRYKATSVSNKAYTASKDTYVDIDSTQVPTYTEVANGAASPALSSGFIRVAKVVTSGAAITSVTQTNIDSLGNQIYPASEIYAEKFFTTGVATVWTKPAGLKYVVVEVVGGGGAGAFSQATGAAQHSHGSGGGGGGYSRKKILATTLGTTETVTIGAGGSANTTTANNGASSSFGAHATGGGGNAGTSILGANTGGFYTAGGTGGAGSSGDINLTGMSGGIAGTFTTNNNVCYSGPGGNAPLGWGAGGRAVSANAGGGAGNNYGGGGSGAAASSSIGAQSGGAGADGIVIVREYF